ncbi:hypothetical protein B0H13DRAFT_1868396 [Mycena leptocephala]|nr:hypothetical protein B0H13DRAFT_1868396 [Mycena leptocephala]
MAQRRAPAKPRKAEAVEDFDFLASQQSTGSDDQALQRAVAQQLMSSVQGKEAQGAGEEVFPGGEEQTLVRGIDHILRAMSISAAIDEVRSTVDATEQVYAKFILDYAASEDAIRALWMEIKKEEQTLVEIAKKQRAANDVMRAATERAQIAGMAQVKEACHETRRIMETLLPTTA